MSQGSAEHLTIEPLSYHRALVAYLKAHEPEVWAWASAQKTRDDYQQQVRSELLRDTYRLEPDAHPDVYASLRLAMQRLGVEAPATLYQAGSQQMNASLVFVPGEIHVVLQGQILERLGEDERLALFGHEVAHYLLWLRDSGDYHVADRILCDALAARQASASHAETLRRYSLHTELFADRAGALAAQSVAAAVSTLVKVETGIANPDPAAYLRQAAEIDSGRGKRSAARTHPENVVRARALDLWWRGEPELDEWVAEKLCGPLVLNALDLPDQLRLTAMTRGFLAYFLADASVRAEPLLNQARHLFPDWRDDEPAVTPAAFREARVDASVLDYLNALMLDLSLVDADTQDAALLRTYQVARELDSVEALQTNLKRDARLGRRELDKLKKKADTVVAA